MNKKFFAAVLGIALVLPVAAQAEGMYATLGVGQSKYSSFSTQGATFSELKPTGVQIGVGYSIDKIWDVEAGYIHFGKKTGTATLLGVSEPYNLQTQSIYLAGIGNYAVTDAFSAFGKLGSAFNRSKIADAVSSTTDNKVQALIGAGLSYQFTKEITGLVDYTYYGKVSEADFKLSLLSVGLRYNF
jgi:OOP family OmpA-OmpF porin